MPRRQQRAVIFITENVVDSVMRCYETTLPSEGGYSIRLVPGVGVDAISPGFLENVQHS